MHWRRLPWTTRWPNSTAPSVAPTTPTAKSLEHGAQNINRIHPLVANRGPFYVYVHYRGSLDDLALVGFDSVSSDREGVALGVMRFENLDRIAAHPVVLRLEIGESPHARLDQSIPDIGADQVRTKTPQDTFTGRTGVGVIVAILDTGIDYRHVDFLKTGEIHKSRILRIWDMGLTPTATESGPDAALLSGGATYGVEYKDTQIDADLASLAADSDPSVRHLDCAGHGTHVASIATGSGRARVTPRTGVAPEASIIGVRYLSLPEPTIDQAGIALTPNKLFKDAVRYVLNVASQTDGGKPVVVNMSFGSDLGSHDGTSEREVWLAGEFLPAQTGRACVIAAGNENSFGYHVEVDFPAAGGERRVPFQVADLRGEVKSDWDTCTWRDTTVALQMEFWYVRGTAKIEVAVKLPDRAADGSQTTKTSSFASVPGGVAGLYFGRKGYKLLHQQAPDVTVGTSPLQRNVIELTLTAEGTAHAEASTVYELIIRSDGAAHLEGWTASRRGQFIVFGHAAPIGTTPTLPSGVSNPRRHQITSPASAHNTIAVASYTAEPTPADPLNDRPPKHQIGNSSSRGGLVEYTGAAGLPLKPDLAAPGVEIDAAESMGRGWLVHRSRLIRSAGYTRMEGTSMAAPHVAGTIALMLQARPNLTVAKIREILTDPANLRPRPTSAVPDEDLRLRLTYGAGLLDVKKIMDHVETLPP